MSAYEEYGKLMIQREILTLSTMTAQAEEIVP